MVSEATGDAGAFSPNGFFYFPRAGYVGSNTDCTKWWTEYTKDSLMMSSSEPEWKPPAGWLDECDEVNPAMWRDEEFDRKNVVNFIRFGPLDQACTDETGREGVYYCDQDAVGPGWFLSRLNRQSYGTLDFRTMFAAQARDFGFSKVKKRRDAIPRDVQEQILRRFLPPVIYRTRRSSLVGDAAEAKDAGMKELWSYAESVLKVELCLPMKKIPEMGKPANRGGFFLECPLYVLWRDADAASRRASEEVLRSSRGTFADSEGLRDRAGHIAGALGAGGVETAM